MSTETIPDRPELECENCGVDMTDICCEAEAERVAKGFTLHCDNCTDPDYAGAYGMWECRDCGVEGMDCTCPAGPVYCKAEGCTSERGNVADDGTCDGCGEPATVAHTYGWTTLHECAKCAAGDLS